MLYTAFEGRVHCLPTSDAIDALIEVCICDTDYLATALILCRQVYRSCLKDLACAIIVGRLLADLFNPIDIVERCEICKFVLMYSKTNLVVADLKFVDADGCLFCNI